MQTVRRARGRLALHHRFSARLHHRTAVIGLSYLSVPARRVTLFPPVQISCLDISWPQLTGFSVREGRRKARSSTEEMISASGMVEGRKKEKKRPAGLRAGPRIPTLAACMQRTEPAACARSSLHGRSHRASLARTEKRERKGGEKQNGQRNAEPEYSSTFGILPHWELPRDVQTVTAVVAEGDFSCPL